jgi:putative oxidoreductase
VPGIRRSLFGRRPAGSLSAVPGSRTRDAETGGMHMSVAAVLGDIGRKTMKQETWNSIGLLILRIGIGLFMLVAHGWGKLVNFGDLAGRFPDPIGLGSGLSLTLAVFAEVLCAILIVVGLGTRFAAVPLLITMLVAAFVVHADDPWAKKEFALLYAIPFLTLVFTGGGQYALDRFVRFKKP